MKFGIAIPIYRGTSLSEFDRCLKSVFEEADLLQRIVIAQDGSVVPEIENAVQVAFEAGLVTDIVSSQDNVGLGQILNKVVAELPDVDFWFRIDSDDFNVNSRIKVQTSFLLSNPEIDVLHGGIEEFSDDQKVFKRQYAEGLLSAQHRSWTRNPVNHVSCALSRRVFSKYGGYSPTLRFCQDYELWGRILSHGGIILGLGGAPLVRVDVGSGIHSKRNLDYFVDEVIALLANYRRKQIKFTSLLVAITARLVVRVLLPSGLAKLCIRMFR